MVTSTLIRARTLARGVAATVLGGTARVLTVGAQTLGRAAQALRPDTTGPGPAGPVTADEMRGLYESRGRVKEPPQESSAELAAAAREPATHIAELASRAASEVVSAIQTLSTDELRLLLEHEETNKRRKTVLQAIERAGADHAASR